MRPSILLSLVLVIVTAASAEPRRNTYESGKIVSVQKLASDATSFLGSPSDAPLQASIFVYEVSIRVDDSILTARYESGIDYLPASLMSGRSVKIRTEGHRVYFKEPSLEDFEFTVVSHERVRGRHVQDGSTEHFQNCGANRRGSLSVTRAFLTA
ncbi:MAG: hypothetical protein LAO24_22685 [Acidobacteriia bacterium]|nr:hypothetical protein [Terriglobia bacterium]